MANSMHTMLILSVDKCYELSITPPPPPPPPNKNKQENTQKKTNLVSQNTARLAVVKQPWRLCMNKCYEL